MPPMIKLLFNAVGPRTVRGFTRQCQRPRAVQEELLRFMVESNKDTALWSSVRLWRHQVLR